MLICTSMEGKKIILNGNKSKILIITYYWPPSGGSGVQRWMYFAKYLKKLGYLPFVITVDESKASYPVLDHTLNEDIKDLKVIKTGTFEPLKWYSRIITGDKKIGIPQGEVKTNNLLDSALGYYIFPILSVFLGIMLLKEKYNRNKIISVILVIIALIYFLIKLGEVPWIGITVALTFSLYGLIRKKVKVSSDIGLLVETLLLTPIAILLFIFLTNNNLNIFSINEPLLSFYLFWAGLMTLIPLFWYTKGFVLIGIGPASMIFFLTPTAQFFLGLYYFNEPLIVDELIAFVFIWLAVIIYLNELRKE